MTDELIMLVGIAGSGKSTWAKQKEREYLEDGYSTVIISRDAIRFDMLKDGEDYFDRENEVFNEFIRQINLSLEMGINKVFVDATHLTEKARAKVLRRLVHDSATSLTFVTIDCPSSVAIKQNNERSGLAKVPERVIKQMYASLTYPSSYELPDDQYEYRTVIFKKEKPKDT